VQLNLIIIDTNCGPSWLAQLVRRGVSNARVM